MVRGAGWGGVRPEGWGRAKVVIYAAVRGTGSWRRFRERGFRGFIARARAALRHRAVGWCAAGLALQAPNLTPCAPREVSVKWSCARQEPTKSEFAYS